MESVAATSEAASSSKPVFPYSEYLKPESRGMSSEEMLTSASVPVPELKEIRDHILTTSNAQEYSNPEDYANFVSAYILMLDLIASPNHIIEYLPDDIKKSLFAAIKKNQETHPDNPSLSCAMGSCYLNQIGTPKEMLKETRCEEAFKFYEESAAQGNAVAEYSLGYCYECRIGTPAEMDPYHRYSLAFMFYKQSAAQGYAPAQINLGRLYYNGIVPFSEMPKAEEEEKAFELFQKSAAQGNADGQYNCGIVLRNRGNQAQAFLQFARAYKNKCGESRLQNFLFEDDLLSDSLDNTPLTKDEIIEIIKAISSTTEDAAKRLNKQESTLVKDLIVASVTKGAIFELSDFIKINQALESVPEIDTNNNISCKYLKGEIDELSKVSNVVPTRPDAARSSKIPAFFRRRVAVAHDSSSGDMRAPLFSEGDLTTNPIFTSSSTLPVETSGSAITRVASGAGREGDGSFAPKKVGTVRRAIEDARRFLGGGGAASVSDELRTTLVPQRPDNPRSSAAPRRGRNIEAFSTLDSPEGRSGSKG